MTNVGSVSISPYRLLFVNKIRQHYWGCDEGYAGTISSGLGNSVRFIVDMLNANGIPAQSAEVVDNNSIWKEITAFHPSHVILEALWVVPTKIDVLRKLYPRVQWAVRLHSNVPFISQEGIATQWIAGYLARDVEVMCNSLAMQADVQQMALDYGRPQALVTYAPNYYPPPALISPRPPMVGKVHIGCFGAIRPLKNQLAQAVAAVSFANQLNLNLFFHINCTRIEGSASPILKNINELFINSVGATHTLVQEPWMPWMQFKQTLATMDISMQVSFNETFNIVAADSVAVGVPVVASPAIPWLNPQFQVSPNDVRGMAGALAAAFPATAMRLATQVANLTAWSQAAQDVWIRRFS